jgi:ADP-ribose pyrophosphatase
MSIEPWSIESEELIFAKFGRQIVKRIYLMPDGARADFYIRKERNAAGVLALTTDQKVILVKQYRPGPDKVLLEMPGGFIDEKGSDPQLTAEKELLEETGYKGSVQFVTNCIDDAYSTMERSLFVATDCKKIANQQLEKTEFAEVELMSLKDFRRLLRSGQMTDVEAGYLALDHLNLL